MATNYTFKLLDFVKQKNFTEANDLFAKLMKEKMDLALQEEQKSLMSEDGNLSNPKTNNDAISGDKKGPGQVDYCGECGEPWPCSVVKNKGAYRGEIVAKHHIA